MPTGMQLVQAPPGEPLSLADAKAWLRVDSDDTTQDAAIVGLIAAARAYVEGAYDRQLVSATWQSRIDRFPRYSSSAVWQYNSDAIWQQRLPVTQLSGQWYPDRSSIRFPRPPLQQLAALTYVDGGGVQQSLVNSVAAGVTGTGSQTVTPASMTGIAAGTSLVVDVGAAQETITVASVTSSTFTATFASTHPAQVPLWLNPGAFAGQPLAGGRLVDVDTTTEPGRAAPSYGQVWPIVRQQLASVQVQFVAGYGPATTVASAIAAGQQTVTPASMYGIYPGTVLWVDTGSGRERVAVQSVTASTFTALFGQAHAAGVQVLPGIPDTILQAMRLLVAHWYEHREAVGEVGGKVELAVQSLLMNEWDGEYR